MLNNNNWRFIVYYYSKFQIYLHEIEISARLLPSLQVSVRNPAVQWQELLLLITSQYLREGHVYCRASKLHGKQFSPNVSSEQFVSKTVKWSFIKGKGDIKIIRKTSSPHFIF